MATFARLRGSLAPGPSAASGDWSPGWKNTLTCQTSLPATEGGFITGAPPLTTYTHARGALLYLGLHKTTHWLSRFPIFGGFWQEKLAWF